MALDLPSGSSTVELGLGSEEHLGWDCAHFGVGLCALLYCFSPRWVSLNDPKSSTGLDGSDNTRCLSELLC